MARSRGMDGCGAQLRICWISSLIQPTRGGPAVQELGGGLINRKRKTYRVLHKASDFDCINVVQT